MNENPAYARERDSTKDEKLVMCGRCKGFYGRQYFRRHRAKCAGDASTTPRSVPAKLLRLSTTVDEQFKQDILGRFSNDTAGNLCQTDSSLLQYGSRVYHSIECKKDKATEVKKSVMSDMRRLALLFLEFQKVHSCAENSAEMLQRNSFDHLMQAIRAYTRKL